MTQGNERPGTTGSGAAKRPASTSAASRKAAPKSPAAKKAGTKKAAPQNPAPKKAATKKAGTKKAAPPKPASGSTASRRATAGVRGPQGPQAPPRAGASRGAAASPLRARFEDLSARPLTTLHRLPRWIMVVAPGLFLFGGLVLTGPWAPLGSLLLLLVGAFLAWLLALAWPRLSGGSRMLRLIIIVAIIGLAYFKALGRF